MKKLLLTIAFALFCLNPVFAQGKSETTSGPVEIEYFNMKSETQDIMAHLISAFEMKNPDIKVIQTNTPDAQTVFKTRLAAHDIPDIVNVYPASNMYKQYFRDGFLANLDGESFLEHIPDATLALSQDDGKNFCLPMTMSVYGIYVRTDLLAKYGLKEPTTYPELIHVCKVLQKNGIIPIAFSDKATWTIGQILERLIGVIDNNSDAEFQRIADGTLSAQDSPILNTFARMMIELHQYSYPDTMAVSYEDSLSDVVSGKCAMVIMGSWALGTMETSDPTIDDRIELIPFPNPTDKKTKVPVNVDTAFAISNTTKHKEACERFLSFLAEKSQAQYYADHEKTPNVVKGVTYSIEPHKQLVEYLAEGNIFLSPVVIWPDGLRDQLKIPAQQLYIDHNVETFLESCGKMIKNYYNQ